MTDPATASLVLVTGPEEFLVERAVSGVVAGARVAEPELEVIRLESASYEAGALQMHASPSLFGGVKALVVTGLHEAPDELQADVLTLLSPPDPDLLLVVAHGGGLRGKKVLDAMRKSGARVIDCPAVKSDRDKTDFVMKEFAAARRKITSEGVRALIEAVGKDLRELAAACSQLISDTEGTVDDAVVDTYHGGKVEATGFRVADATVAGQPGEALRLLRHAIASGVDPVPIVAVIASQLRQLIKVGSAGRGSSAQLAREPRHGTVAGRQGSPRRRALERRRPRGRRAGHRRGRPRGQGRGPRPRVCRRARHPDDRPGAGRRLSPPPGIPQRGARSGAAPGLEGSRATGNFDPCVRALGRARMQALPRAAHAGCPTPGPELLCRPLTATIRPNERNSQRGKHQVAAQADQDEPAATERNKAVKSELRTGSASSVRPPRPVTDAASDALKVASTKLDKAVSARASSTRTRPPTRSRPWRRRPRRSDASDPQPDGPVTSR